MQQNSDQEACQYIFEKERKKISIMASNGPPIQVRKKLNKQFDSSPYTIQQGQDVEIYQYADGEEIVLINEKGQDYQLKNNQKILFSIQKKDKEVEELLKKLNENQNDGKKQEKPSRIHCIIMDYSKKILYCGSITQEEIFNETKSYQEILETFELIKDHINTALNDQSKGNYVKFDKVNSQFLIHQEIPGYKGKIKMTEIKIQLKDFPMEIEKQNIDNDQVYSDCLQNIENMQRQVSEIGQSYKIIYELSKKIEQLEIDMKSQKQIEAQKYTNLQNTIMIQYDEIKQQNENDKELAGVKQEIEKRVNDIYIKKTNDIDSKLKQSEKKFQNKITELEKKNLDLEVKILQLQKIIKELQFKLKQNVEILTINDLIESIGWIRHSRFENYKISRLELIIVDDKCQFEIGLLKNPDVSKIHIVANSYRFLFPEGTVYRGNEGGNKLISYYPIVDDQIGLEVNTVQSVLIVYINGVKNFSMKISSNFSEFSFYVKVGSNVNLEDVFEMEDQTYLEY